MKGKGLALDYRDSPLITAFAILSGLVLVALPMMRTSEAQSREFNCGAIFNSETSLESLIEFFGVAHVDTATLHVGEGFYEMGAVVFGDSDARVEVFWKNPEVSQGPRVMRIWGNASPWATKEGLRLGLDLKSAQEINGRPFRLAGFGWDYAGTVYSWEDGRLARLRSPDAPCTVFARFGRAWPDDPEKARAYEQVLGDRAFFSDHREMQLLNPTIYELGLSFR